MRFDWKPEFKQIERTRGARTWKPERSEKENVIMTPRWKDNLVQFARLLCEISATHELDFVPLCESTDLEPEEIIEVLDQADEVWEHAKAMAFKAFDGSTIH